MKPDILERHSTRQYIEVRGGGGMIETAFVGQISQQPQVLSSNTDLHLIKFCLNKQQHDGLQFSLTFRLKYRTVLQNVCLNVLNTRRRRAFGKNNKSSPIQYNAITYSCCTNAYVYIIKNIMVNKIKIMDFVCLMYQTMVE